MKRSELLRMLAEIATAKGLALVLVRNGANHDIYEVGRYHFPVARHNEIPELTARGTIRKVEAL
jgi:hypothetical protein